jgi:SAM-dependent methyltransferase
MARNRSWEELSTKYEALSVQADSLDTLLDWPAQLRAVGDVVGKRILDIGCGSGRKALYFALAGAAQVTGVDISDSFISQRGSRAVPPNLKFCVGDLSRLSRVEALSGQQFDIAVCFQAIGYSENLAETIGAIRGFVRDGGRFVLTTAHPFRYVVEKMEREQLAPASAYRDEGVYSYPSTWDPSITVSHRKPMISTHINALLENGFRLDRISEPDLSEEHKRTYPHKAEWMARYFGTMVYEATAI